MSYEETREPEPSEEPRGTCDWGYCDGIAVAWRWGQRYGWLPVCRRHARSDPSCPRCGLWQRQCACTSFQ